MRRVGVGALATTAVTAFIVSTVIAGKREEAEAARAAAQSALLEVGKQRDAKVKALDNLLQLADSKRVRDLLDEVDGLWPLEPTRSGAMATWHEVARRLVRRRDFHRE